MDLALKYPAKALPNVPYIGLFGNHQNNWRTWVINRLANQGVSSDSVYDSTDLGWRVINDSNGDELQSWIDTLVERQHRAMKNAGCLIFSLDTSVRNWDIAGPIAVPPPENSTTSNIFAARCELGWLAGCGITTFVWIPSGVTGRNYLRAVIRMYSNLVEVDDLGIACEKALTHLHSLST